MRSVLRATASNLKLFYEAVINCEFLFEVAFGMNVDDDVEIFDRGSFLRPRPPSPNIQPECGRLAAPEHRIAIQREPGMVEAHRLDERDVLRGVVGVEVLFGVALGRRPARTSG